MADLLDLLTEAEGQRAAMGSNTPTTAHATVIARMVTAVSRRVDRLCGPVVHRTVTEYHDGGQSDIRPYRTPVASVTTLRHWDGTTTTAYTLDTWGTAANVNGFRVDRLGPHGVRVVRRSGGTDTAWLSGVASIELVYVAGRYATTAAVDPLFKEAAAAIVRRLWQRESGSWARASDPFDPEQPSGGFFRAVDPMVSEFLSAEMPIAMVA